MKIALLITDDREPARQYDCETPWFGTAPTALLQGFEKMPDLEVHILSCTQQPMKASPQKLAENIFFHSLLVPKIGWLRTGYQGCIRAVRHKLREIRPDLVHGQGSERDQNISAVFSGYPNVLTIHGNMRAVARGNGAKPFSYAWLTARLEAISLRRTLGVVCITTYTERSVEDLAAKTWLVPNAVDPSFFQIARQPVDPPRILCVGNVLPLKNQNALIRALDDLPGPKDFELIFLGALNRATSYGREFLDLVNARPWCRYEGYVDRAGLKVQLASAHGLIHPTLEDNCPMVVLESMAAGVPVAASRIGGIPDLIHDGTTGLLFDPKDGKAINAALLFLLTTSPSDFAAKAQADALTRFHPQRVAAQHMEIYREVLSGSLEKEPSRRLKPSDRKNFGS
jgi:glycosyltransferase involved in cell wall biosynthesis